MVANDDNGFSYSPLPRRADETASLPPVSEAVNGAGRKL